MARQIELARPFFVLATQNPHDYAGTFPLPESQLDRFMLRIRIGYPPAQTETRLFLDGETDRVKHVPTVMDARPVLRASSRSPTYQDRCSACTYLQALLSATRSSPLLALGASTRAGMNLARAARARALLRGRNYCVADDFHDLAVSVLAHRVRLASTSKATCRLVTRQKPRSGTSLNASQSRSDTCEEALRKAPRDSTDPPEGGPLRRLLRRLRPPRKLRFTREGKYFVLITFGVGVAAINTGNNLLYLVLGMLLALIIVSGVMSEFSPAQSNRHPKAALTSPGRSLPPRRNRSLQPKAQVPSYAIEVEDLRAGQPTDKRCFFLKISPRSAQVAAYRRKPHRRGRDRHTGFRVATRFPFGLFEKSLHYSLKGELIIYPAVDPFASPTMQLAPTSAAVIKLDEAPATKSWVCAPCEKAMTHGTSIGARAPCPMSSS